MNRLIAVLAVLAVAGLLVSAAASWVARKRAPFALTAGPAVASSAAVGRAMLAAQLRAVAGVVFAAVMFVALFRVSIGVTGQVGLPIALTAGVSASGGLLLYASLPAAGRLAVKGTPAKGPAATGPAVEPSTPPPERWAFLRPRMLALPLAVLTAFVAFLVAAGLTSSPDGQGRYRQLHLTSGALTSAAGPYPGWYYGIPLLLITLVLAGSAFLALRRIASTPSLPDPRMAVLDRRWREISGRLLLRLATGALLGYFGGAAVIAGQAMASLSLTHDAGHPLQPLLTLGIATGVLGALLAVTGAWLLVLAARAALTIRTATRALTPAQSPAKARSKSQAKKQAGRPAKKPQRP